VVTPAHGAIHEKKKSHGELKQPQWKVPLECNPVQQPYNWAKISDDGKDRRDVK
jgi:hypothetical protein